MSVPKSKYVLFARFERSEGIQSSNFKSFVLSSSNPLSPADRREVAPLEISDETSSSVSPGEAVHQTNDVEESAETGDVKLAHLLSSFIEATSGFRPLIQLAFTFIPVMKQVIISQHIYGVICDEENLLERSESSELFGVTQRQFSKINPTLERFNELTKAGSALSGAVLLSLVATFDSFIADTIRVMLRARPEKIINSSKSMNIKKILEMKSFDDVIESAINDELDSIMRGNHDEQIKYIENTYSIDIRGAYDHWAKFIEIFERRNLVAHGDSKANDQYINNCRRHGFETDQVSNGSQLDVSRKYLSRSNDTLVEFGILLIFTLWKKHFPDTTDEAYVQLSAIGYRFIKQKRFALATRILEFALYKQTAKISDATKKRMTINLANAFKKIKKEKRAAEILSGVDWSASADIFQICIASLRGDVEGFVKKMDSLSRSEDISMDDFREWPVFDWVRDNDAVQKKFEELYGEPLNSIAPETTSAPSAEEEATS